MFCRYHDGGKNPRLLLKPIKEEDEWDSPHIVRYLDVLSHEEIEKIKELAKPRVRPGFSQDFGTGRGEHWCIFMDFITLSYLNVQ